MTKPTLQQLTLLFVLSTLVLCLGHKYQRIQNYPKELAQYQTRVFHCEFEVRHILKVKSNIWCREPYNNSCYSIHFQEGFEYVTKESNFSDSQKIYITTLNKCKILGDTANNPELVNSPEATRLNNDNQFLIRDNEWIVPLSELANLGQKPSF
jgi:hypothetical protein